jgi:YbgC/YbaW family acyl-CoA thioester hydrolase
MKHSHKFRVEWGDTDAAAIVFYPNFFKWFDSGTWRLLIAVGLTREALDEQYGLIGCPLVEASAKFTRPARFWDEVELTSYVSSWRSKTFDLGHEIRVDGELCVKGKETRVLARHANAEGTRIEAVPIPAAIRDLLPAIET